MTATCCALITQEFKTKKALSVPPVIYQTFIVEGQVTEQEVDNPYLATAREVCFGEVTVKLKAVVVPEWDEGTTTELHVEWTCSRCRSPWVPEKRAIDAAVMSGEIDITRLVLYSEDREDDVVLDWP